MPTEKSQIENSTNTRTPTESKQDTHIVGLFLQVSFVPRLFWLKIVSTTSNDRRLFELYQYFAHKTYITIRSKIVTVGGVKKYECCHFETRPLFVFLSGTLSENLLQCQVTNYHHKDSQVLNSVLTIGLHTKTLNTDEE